MASLVHGVKDSVVQSVCGFGLPSLTGGADGSVVSTPGCSQLVTGQLLSGTDCWPLVISMLFVKDHSLGQRNTKWMSLEMLHFSLPYGYAMLSVLALLQVPHTDVSQEEHNQY